MRPAWRAPAWAACRAALERRLGLEASAADAALARAFGWGGQAYLRRERVEEVPAVAVVDAALDLLTTEVGLDQETAAAVVSEFPEVLGLPGELMQQNIEVLRGKWFLRGAALARTIARKPRMLGVLIDCEGSCAGLCTRCWAQM